MMMSREYTTPQAIDILGGRGAKAFEHPGNKMLRATVCNRLAEYCAPGFTRKNKSVLIAEILESTLKSKGGRFLKYDNGEGAWYDAGYKEARCKISHAFRDASVPNKVKCLVRMKQQMEQRQPISAVSMMRQNLNSLRQVSCDPPPERVTSSHAPPTTTRQPTKICFSAQLDAFCEEDILKALCHTTTTPRFSASAVCEEEDDLEPLCHAPRASSPVDVLLEEGALEPLWQGPTQSDELCKEQRDLEPLWHSSTPRVSLTFANYCGEAPGAWGDQVDESIQNSPDAVHVDQLLLELFRDSS